MQLQGKDWRRFWGKNAAPKVPNDQVMALFARSPKTRIFWKKAKGGPRKIFQKSPKKKPSFETLKSTLAQITLSFIYHALKVQRLEKILAQDADPKLPEWLSYGISRNVTQNPHFLKKCKGGTKENFSKIAQKVALVWKAQTHSGANGIILYLVCAYSAKTGKDFGAKSGSKSARRLKLWQFRQGHPKPAFSQKVQTGDQTKFSKIA